MVFILNIFDQLIMAKAEIAAIEIAYTSPPPQTGSRSLVVSV